MYLWYVRYAMYVKHGGYVWSMWASAMIWQSCRHHGTYDTDTVLCWCKGIILSRFSKLLSLHTYLPPVFAPWGGQIWRDLFSGYKIFLYHHPLSQSVVCLSEHVYTCLLLHDNPPPRLSNIVCVLSSWPLFVVCAQFSLQFSTSELKSRSKKKTKFPKARDPRSHFICRWFGRKEYPRVGEW